MFDPSRSSCLCAGLLSYGEWSLLLAAVHRLLIRIAQLGFQEWQCAGSEAVACPV